ncbi:MAG: LysM peptidoglycan-binding domain-containing protein [Rickettsiales bacterium]|nr:LysM peptidoglycan-binding domain-containing protein [Rickettsiales bacterium]
MKRKSSKKSIIIFIIAAFIVVAILISLSRGKIENQNQEKNLNAVNIEQIEMTGESYKKDNGDIKEEKIVKPSFDVVRFQDKKGVFTGRADKEVVVHILSGEKELTAVKTDNRGEFVFLPSKEFDKGQYEFSLYYEKDGKKILSEQNALIALDSNDAVVAVLVGGDEDSKLLVQPNGENIGDLKVQLVEYDFKNNMFASGMAKADTKVNVYLNDKLIETVKTDKDGKWVLNYETALIQDTAYSIRADQLDENEKVIARVENKFSTENVKTDKQYAVVKGDNLWKIAYKQYGKGVKYLLIFEANKAQIKNPDLIYPNQILKITKS